MCVFTIYVSSKWLRYWIAIKWVAPVIATSVLAGVTDSHIDLIIVLVFHEQQLLIIVVNVMLHAQFDCVFVFRKCKHQTCIIF